MDNLLQNMRTLASEPSIDVVSTVYKARKGTSKPRNTPTLKKDTSRAQIKPRAKKKRVNVWEQYGLQRPRYIRYSGLGGVLWYLVSNHVRKTEFEQFGGYCVDGCGRVVLDWHEADCGHFRSARSLSTRFLRENLGLQSKYCNSPRGGNGNQYAFGKAIDQRYGLGTADRLTMEAAKTSRPFSKDWYHQEILKYL